jgi:hypothetical protein
MHTRIMQRMQISLTAEERLLDAETARTGRSTSALIRDAVKIVYGVQRSSEVDRAAMRLAFGSWADRDTAGAGWEEERRSGRRLHHLDA